MEKSKEQCITEIMKRVDKMTVEQRKEFLTYLMTIQKD